MDDRLETLPSEFLRSLLRTATEFTIQSVSIPQPVTPERCYKRIKYDCEGTKKRPSQMPGTNRRKQVLAERLRILDQAERLRVHCMGEYLTTLMDYLILKHWEQLHAELPAIFTPELKHKLRQTPRRKIDMEIPPRFERWLNRERRFKVDLDNVVAHMMNSWKPFQ